jgi:hypothetical protein
MKLPLRQALANSHVSAAAIVILLVWSIEWACRALFGPVVRLINFLFTAVAILDIPYISPKLNFEDRRMLLDTCFYFFNASCTAAAAWLLSHWIYGAGPIHSLISYRRRLARRIHA